MKAPKNKRNQVNVANISTFLAQGIGTVTGIQSQVAIIEVHLVCCGVFTDDTVADAMNPARIDVKISDVTAY